MESQPPLRATTGPIRLIGLLLSVLVLAVQLGDIRLPVPADVVRLCGADQHGGLHGRRHHDRDGTTLLATTMQSEADAAALVPGSATAGRMREARLALLAALVVRRLHGDGSGAWQPARGPPAAA